MSGCDALSGMQVSLPWAQRMTCVFHTYLVHVYPPAMEMLLILQL